MTSSATLMPSCTKTPVRCLILCLLQVNTAVMAPMECQMSMGPQKLLVHPYNCNSSPDTNLVSPLLRRTSRVQEQRVSDDANSSARPRQRSIDPSLRPWHRLHPVP